MDRAGYLLQGSWIASSLARREDGLSFSQVLQMVRRLSGPEASRSSVGERRLADVGRLSED